MHPTFAYLEANKERFLEELLALLRIPSISADPAFKNDVLKTAEFVANKLTEAGADKVEICPTAGYPIVYGEKIIKIKITIVEIHHHKKIQLTIILQENLMQVQFHQEQIKIKTQIIIIIPQQQDQRFFLMEITRIIILLHFNFRNSLTFYAGAS